MFDHDVTTILERLVGDASVAPPPVELVSARGRRRLLFRRAGQVMATAAVVTAFTVGGLVLRPGPSAESIVPATGVNVLPGQPPTAAQLLGTWHWVGRDLSGRPRTSGHPSPVTFSHQSVTYPTDPGSGTPLYWSMQVDCRGGWKAFTGDVHLGPDGSFSTDKNAVVSSCVPNRAVAGTGLGDVLARTRWLRLVNGDLQFFDAHRHLIGAFSKS